ncbi:hypothetical protein GCM10027037_06520 [Mucilaginibacter koreensis]
MIFCDKSLNGLAKRNYNTIELIKQYYLQDDQPWYIGYSGGKDSSALLKLVFCGLKEVNLPKKNINVIYCDTGVEIPVLSKYVAKTLNAFQLEADKFNLPFTVKIAKPVIQDTYFSKVIGRGYPPPSNKFRWCTDRLRIKPIQAIIKAHAQEAHTILLGVRKGESSKRNHTIDKHKTGDEFFLKQKGNAKSLIFTPIINYDITDVWNTLIYNVYPHSIDVKELSKIYKNASAECPIIKDPKDSPCGKGRFGCWTCTVVKEDKAVTNLVKQGYVDLKPLLDFRNWLSFVRNLPEYRCKTRRNGLVGLGPFTLKARSEILDRLLKTEILSGTSLITTEEIYYIRTLWNADISNDKYKED